MRVSVDIVHSKYKELPLPVEQAEMHVLQDAQLSIIQWPRNAIVLVKDFVEDTNQDESLNIASSAKSLPKSLPMPISENLKQQPQPSLMLDKVGTKKMTFKILKKWLSYVGIIKDKSINVIFFFKRLIDRPEADGPVHIVAVPGIFEGQSYEFNIEVDDMVRLISQRWLDISIIAWFEIMLHSAIRLSPHEGQKTNTAFMNPFAIQEKSCDIDENGVIDYMCRAITHHQDNTLVLAPYWQSEHWVLFMIHRHQRMGFILDSLWRTNGMKPQNYKLTKLVDRAISRYLYLDDSIGSMKWVMVECNQQVGTWDFGSVDSMLCGGYFSLYSRYESSFED